MCYLSNYICNSLDVKEYTHSISLRGLAVFEQFERARKEGKPKPGGTWEPPSYAGYTLSQTVEHGVLNVMVWPCLTD